jgi:polyisoprenoid-binding protein YceI
MITSRFLILTISLLFLFNYSQAKNKWKLDKAHSLISFEVEHMVVLAKDNENEDAYTMGMTEGKFEEFEISFAEAKEDFSKSKLEATIQVISIDTDNKLRDAHLISEDFLYANKYPQITFKSKSFQKVEEDKFILEGERTIRGLKKTIQLETILKSRSDKTSEADYISLTAKGFLNRHDYDMNWNVIMTSGGFRVASNIQFTIQANFQKVK